MGKRIHPVKVLLDDEELLALSRLSVTEQRAIADLAHIILRRYLFGHGLPNLSEGEGTKGDGK